MLSSIRKPPMQLYSWTTHFRYAKHLPMERNGNIVAFPERRHGARVGDLRSWHYLRVTCRFCGHSGRVYAQSLWRRCSMDDRIIDVMQRVRCRHCGGVGAANWDIWQIDRNA